MMDAWTVVESRFLRMLYSYHVGSIAGSLVVNDGSLWQYRVR